MIRICNYVTALHILHAAYYAGVCVTAPLMNILQISFVFFATFSLFFAFFHPQARFFCLTVYIYVCIVQYTEAFSQLCSSIQLFNYLAIHSEPFICDSCRENSYVARFPLLRTKALLLVCAMVVIRADFIHASS